MSQKNSINLTFVLLISLVFVVACGLIKQTSSTNSPSTSPTPETTFNKTPTPDDESERIKQEERDQLQQRVDDLEKKIQNQNKQQPSQIQPQTQQVPQINAPKVQKIPDSERDKNNNAWVNSPGDGFLALRSEPNADYGYRIVKIPHGSNVKVLSCLGGSRVGGKAGRWCRVYYNGYTGWAFDAWLAFYE